MEEFCHVYKPAKLLICFLVRHRGDLIMDISKKAGARGGTIAPARAILDNRLLQLLSLADVDQDVVFTIMGQEAEKVIPAIVEAAKKEPKKLGGLAVVLDVSGMLFRVPGQDCQKPEESDDPMKSGYQLITVIVNHGYADDVMAAARKAGDRGGTILTARGTGTEEDVKFFGISLVPEKDMLMIAAETSAVPAILEAVAQVPSLRQPGGGVAYYMNIEQFIPLGPNQAG